MTPNRFNIGCTSSLGLRGARILAWGAAALGATAWVSGCSVLYDLSTAQCSTNDDCAPWPGLVCTESVCQEPVYECRTNQECIDSADAFGRAAACIENECQVLTTTECPIVLPLIEDKYFETLAADNTLILGAFGDTSAGYGTYVKNYDLAVTEFTRAGVGRPLVLVVCNNLLEEAQLDTAMTHLADTLKVPGIVSQLESSNLQRAVQGKGLENNIFFMSALDSDSTLIRLEDRGLLWHALSGGEAIGQSMAPIVTRAVNYVAATEPVRVAHVSTPNIRFLADLAGTVGETVTFNGMSVLENLDAGNYESIPVTSAFENDDTADYTEAITRLRDFRPHIVIANATTEFVEVIAPALEAAWDVAAPGQPRPFYILSPWLYNNPRTESFASTPELRRRLIGLNAPAAADSGLYDAYLLRWFDEFGEMAPLGYENFYDAAYYLLYAALGAGESLNSGLDIARGMTRLLSGPQHGVGPMDLAGAASDLGSIGNITLNGTMGPPNFDINGGRSDAGSVWCYNSIGFLRSDLLTYNKDTQEMDGSLNGCFSGF